MTTKEMLEARRLREQSAALRSKARAEGRRLGEVVAQLLETRQAVRQVRLQMRGETSADDDAWSPSARALPGPATHPASRSEWLARFVEHLRALRCGLDAAEALRVGQHAWPSFCLVDPGTAARSMAAILDTFRPPAG